MSERTEKAVELKKKHNCCQAVLLAFQDKLGKSEEELLALGSGFGSGMGGMQGTCGALCGANIVMGLLNKSDTPTKQIMRGMVDDFKDQAGATICGDLKGVKTGKVLCSCPDCVKIATDLAEKALAKG